MKNAPKHMTPAKIEKIERKLDRKHSDRQRDLSRKQRRGAKHAELSMLSAFDFR